LKREKIIKANTLFISHKVSVFFGCIFINMQRIMTISYQNRQSCGIRSHDLLPAEKLVIVNRLLKSLSGFAIGDKVSVDYSPGQVVITKFKKQ